MKTPVVWVAATLTAAIVLTATLLIATGTRGENGSSAGRLDVQTFATGLVHPFSPADECWCAATPAP